MDTFIEKIVKKKKDVLDYAKIFGISVLAIVIIMASFYLGSSFLTTLIIMIAGYGGWFLIKSVNVEYEYSCTNNYIDIDKIIAQRKRKRLIELDINSFDVFSKATLEQVKKHGAIITNKIYAGSSQVNDNLYFAIFNSKKDGKAMVFFEPDERMIEIIKKYIPRKVDL